VHVRRPDGSPIGEEAESDLPAYFAETSRLDELREELPEPEGNPTVWAPKLET
jgi:hypothetical protein